MKIPIYQVDAFSSRIFSGNPAAVCLLDGWMEERLLQSIAAENNLSETAFLVANGKGYALRWFTPKTEVALCGHATLASAHVLFNTQKWRRETIPFQTRKSGVLKVTRKGDLLEMDFPPRPPHEMDPPWNLKDALGVAPRHVLASEEDLLVVLDSEKTVRETQPDLIALAQLPFRGIIVTARGDQSDFVSRFFAPRVGVPEDPVTGSAHCVLIPYWSRRLEKKDLYAVQVSRRGGELFCKEAGDRVRISGKAVLYMEGTLFL